MRGCCQRSADGWSGLSRGASAIVRLSVPGLDGYPGAALVTVGGWSPVGADPPFVVASDPAAVEAWSIQRLG